MVSDEPGIFPCTGTPRSQLLFGSRLANWFPRSVTKEIRSGEVAVMTVDQEFWRRIYVVALLGMMQFCSAHAQSTIDNVHVEPRTQTARSNSPKAVATTAMGI